MAAGVDDWLVADSEEEDAFAQLPPLENGSGVSAATRPAAAGNLTSPGGTFRRTHAHPSS